MTCPRSQGLVNMAADSSRAHVILLHRCSVDGELGGGWRGTSLTLGSTQLNSTQLTAESTGASEALMIIFCAWYWAAFGKIDRKVTDEDV